MSFGRKFETDKYIIELVKNEEGCDCDGCHYIDSENGECKIEKYDRLCMIHHGYMYKAIENKEEIK